MSLFNFLVILSSEYFELVRRKRRFGFGGVREIGRHPGLMYVAGFEVYAIGGEKWIRKREQIGDRLSKTSQSSEAPASSVIASARILNYNKFQSSSFNKNKIRTAVFLMVLQNICISRDFYLRFWLAADENIHLFDTFWTIGTTNIRSIPFNNVQPASSCACISGHADEPLNDCF